MADLAVRRHDRDSLMEAVVGVVDRMTRARGILADLDRADVTEADIEGIKREVFHLMDSAENVANYIAKLHAMREVKALEERLRVAKIAAGIRE
jgi:hypothetical protein